jgi:hypothetical protein
MSILSLAIVLYCAISLLATLLVYGACIMAGRADRVRTQEAKLPAEAATSLLLRPQPVIARRRS